MRRTVRLTAAGLVVGAVLSLFAAAPASAAEPVVPVQPIPDLPSNTLRMTPTGTGGWSAIDVWKAQLWYASTATSKDLVTIPTTGTKVAVSPKPITAPAQFVRGAAGGPLVGAFMGGFAIGTAGLELYGAVTGSDPLESICGSAFEGVGHVIYMGMMPDCAVGLDDPNVDVPSGTYTGACYQGWCVQLLGSSRTTNSAQTPTFCYSVTSGTRPAGTNVGYPFKSNPSAFQSALPSSFDQSGCSPNRFLYQSTFTGVNESAWAPGVLAIYTTTNGQATVVSNIPTANQSDPERKPSCTIQWEDGSTTTGAGTPYKESAGLPLSAAGLGCKNAWDAKPGAGIDLLPSQIGVESEQGGSKTEIATQQVPDMSPEQRKALDAGQGNGRGLVLERVVDGSVKSCNTWEVDCAQWWTSTNGGTTPGDYRCTFGGNAVSLVECGPYRNTFDAQTSTPTITDPATGQPVPWSGTAVNPGTVAPGVTGGGACGAAWSWNPVDWVLNPIKCASIPSLESVTGARTRIETAWRNSTPGQLQATVAGIAPAFNVPDGGCGGILLPVPNIGPDGGFTIENRAFLPACAGDFFAPWATGFKWFIGIAIAGVGVFAIKRLLDRFVGL